MTTEVWLPVVGHEDTYEVSSIGRVKSIPRARTRGGILKPWLHAGRYPAVRLRLNRKNADGLIHHLMAEAFLGPRPIGQEVRHLDDDGTNNTLTNLAYGTQTENSQDRLRNGRNPQARKTHCKWDHEFTAENTRIRSTATGVRRICITCQHITNMARRGLPPNPSFDPSKRRFGH